jgi:REP element-mobilizing transposase RayT
VFVTTTVLGFAHMLKRPEMKQVLLDQLISDCKFYGAVRHCYCIMDNHLHLVIRSPEMKTVSWFMQQFKKRVSKELLPRLTPTELRCLAPFQGQDKRLFWMRGFKGEAIKDEEMYWACIRYIHLNPVRKEICPRVIDYEWSSAQLFEDCRWREGTGIMEAFE